MDSIVLHSIDGLGDIGWFRQKQKEFLEKIGIKVKQERNRNIKE
jgi:hypothetical protein